MPRFGRLSILLIAAVGACGGKTAPSPAPANTAPGVTADRSIRGVDWSHVLHDLGGGERYPLGGTTEIYYDDEGTAYSAAEFFRVYPRGTPAADGWFTASAPVYGDVDRDLVDDAIVLTTHNTGGSGQFSTLVVYRMHDGAPIPLDGIVGGDRADGGIADVSIAGDGSIVVDRNVNLGGGACCPDTVAREVWTWDGHTLVERRAGHGVPLSI